jgi:phosphoglycolate phosphatase
MTLAGAIVMHLRGKRSGFDRDDRLRGDPSHALMIGDSEVDLRTAKAAGVPIVLVSFGYATTALHGLSPEAVIDHFDELAPRAAALLNGVASARSHA